MQISIIPVPCYPSPATQLRVDNCIVTLGVGLDAQWALLDESGNIVVGPKRANLTTDQYNAWTGDDMFVANCIAGNLPIPVVPVPMTGSVD